jgi:hypothetical protein
MGVEGAGDCEREGVEVALFCGGPRAQADFVESWGGFFGNDAVADLLILWRGCQQVQSLYVRESERKATETT